MVAGVRIKPPAAEGLAESNPPDRCWVSTTLSLVKHTDDRRQGLKGGADETAGLRGPAVACFAA